MDIHHIKQLVRSFPGEVYGFAELIQYAILLPIVEVDGELSVLFEVRSRELRRQPGEICFPGGKVDPEDPDERFCAVRETSEELGIEQPQIEVIGGLGVLVPPVQIAIHTFVGYIRDLQAIQVNEAEVAEVFTVPLQYLLNQEPKAYELQLGLTPVEDFPFELIPGGKGYKFRERRIPEYFYFYQDRIIWGLTARILKQFLDKLKKEII